jgi:hypothetical protein
MFSLNEGNRFVVCLTGVDLRKGLDGLCGLIRYLSLSPVNGDVYVFLNKSRTTMKLLHWEQGVGFRTIRWDELVLFMEGISVKIKRRKRYNFQ